MIGVVKGFGVLLLALGGLAGCQSSPSKWEPRHFVASPSSESPPVKIDGQALSEDQVREDMDFLLHAFERVYGGWEFLRPDFRDRVRHEMTSLKVGLSREEFEEKVSSLSIFSEHIDGHLGFVRPLVIHDPDRLNRRVVNNYLNRKKFWSIESRFVGGKSTLWVSLYEFPFIEDNPDWQEFIQELSRKSEHSSRIVLDLRINPGGALISALALGKMLSPNHPMPSLGESYHVVTPEAVAARTSGPLLQNELSSSAPHWWTSRSRGVTYMIDESSYQEIDVPYLNLNQPILILTSSYCASSCEALVLLLEQNPQVTVMGQNTAGIFHFHSPVQLRLPHSGFLVSMPTGVLKLPGGRFVELRGISPTISVSNLTEVDRHIEQGFWPTKK